MKKIISIILIMTLCVSLVACGGSEPAYNFDADKMSAKIAELIVPTGSKALRDAYAVTEENFDKPEGKYHYGSEVIDLDQLKDSVIVLPNSEWTYDFIIAVKTADSSAVESAEKFVKEFEERTFVIAERFEIGEYSCFGNADNLSVSKAIIEKGGTPAEIATALVEAENEYPIYTNYDAVTLESPLFPLEGSMDKANLEDMYVLFARTIDVHPVMIFKAVEGNEEEMNSAITTYIDQQIQTFTTYMPHVFPKIEGRELYTENGYTILLMSNHNDELKALISSCFVEAE